MASQAFIQKKAVKLQKKISNLLQSYGRKMDWHRFGRDGLPDDSGQYYAFPAALKLRSSGDMLDGGGVDLDTSDQNIVTFDYRADVAEEDSITFDGNTYAVTRVIPEMIGSYRIALTVMVTRESSQAS